MSASGATATRLRSRLWAVGPTLLGLLLVLLERAQQVGLGASSFVFAGRGTLERFPPLPELRSVGGQGYDGLAFYVLALDPFSTELIANAREPGYRQQRILYPALAWLLGQVTAQSVLITLVVVNVAAACAAAWVAAGLAVRWGAHPALGAVVGLSPPMVVGTMYDTAEPLALTLMLAGIVAALDRRPAAVAVLLSGAVLARETTLTAALGLLAWLVLTWVRERRADVPMIAAALAPVAVLAAWQLALWRLWGDVPVLSGGGSRLGSRPVLDVVISVLTPVTGAAPGASGDVQALWWAGRMLLAVAIVAATVTIVRRLRGGRTLWPDLLTTVFVTASAPTLLTGAWLWTPQYTRSASEWLLVSALILIRQPGAVSVVGLAALLLTSVIAVLL